MLSKLIPNAVFWYHRVKQKAEEKEEESNSQDFKGVGQDLLVPRRQVSLGWKVHQLPCRALQVIPKINYVQPL